MHQPIHLHNTGLVENCAHFSVAVVTVLNLFS